MSFEQVINNGFCVGCGACKVSENSHVKIEMKEDGFYEASRTNVMNDKDDIADKVCPFSSGSLNENELGIKLFEGKNFDERVGYFNNILIGSVNNISDKITSSSGGMTTWFATKLFQENEIDSVIHVGQTENVFEYKISYNINDLTKKSNKKSRYYPVTFEELVDYITSTNDRILFIGIPCFVKAIRLLQSELKLTNIKYVASLLCGHMKSKFFAENMAWQLGIKPSELDSIDFRVKKEGLPANKYFVEIKDKTDKEISHQSSLLFGSNWGYGFFKHRACDFCDDIAGELADVSFGDAWLPEYEHDYLGTNIIVSRSDKFDYYLKKYRAEVTFVDSSVDEFYKTQAGNYRHRRDGMNSRINNVSGWLPIKRVFNLNENVSDKRAKLYYFRYLLSQKSTKYFLEAKRKRSYFQFRLRMFPLILKYDYLNIGLIGMVKKNILKLLRVVNLDKFFLNLLKAIKN